MEIKHGFLSTKREIATTATNDRNDTFPNYRENENKESEDETVFESDDDEDASDQEYDEEVDTQ